jgi:hypothetical protein
MGVRKKPIVDRGPKVRIAIRHPQTRTTATGTVLAELDVGIGKSSGQGGTTLPCILSDDRGE